MTTTPAARAGEAVISIGELGEFGFIARITAGLPDGAQVLLGPGDDAALLRAPDGRVVATTDMYVEGRHFRRDWSSGYDIGRRVVAAGLADIAAMGATPTGVLVALGAPAELASDWADDLTAGLRDECAEAGAAVVGGDVVRSEVMVLTVSALGDLAGRDPVTRDGASAGEAVAVCGKLGWSAAGLAVLSRGFRTPRALVEAHRRPTPPYSAGPQAADAGATAMCDVSDGLVQDLGHIAAASGVAVQLDSAAFEVPAPFEQVAAALGGADPLQWVLAGGEDHALAATFAATAVPDGWRVVGRVVEGTGVTVDGQPYQVPSWDSFR